MERPSYDRTVLGTDPSSYVCVCLCFLCFVFGFGLMEMGRDIVGKHLELEEADPGCRLSTIRDPFCDPGL